MNSLIQTQKSSELAAALLSVYLERSEDLPVRTTSSSSTPNRFLPGWCWGEISQSYEDGGCHMNMEVWLCAL